MANFQPLNNYALFILDKLISKYSLKPPFLDVACGNGYVAKHLAKKGWEGKAIDYSKEAVEIAKNNLKNYKKVIVEEKAADKEMGHYRTIFMFDVLEHIKYDQLFLNKISSLLLSEGHLVIAGPSNPNQWGWDDDFYGHYRRYTAENLKGKLIKAKLRPLICYDYTYPIFFFLRKLFITFVHKVNKKSIEKRTLESSFIYSWKIPVVSVIIDKTSLLWYPLYYIQYLFFKNLLSRGSAIIILSKKFSS